MKTKFIPIDYDYFDFQGKNFAKVIGRDEKGKRICVIDSCPVYLWAILKNNLEESKIKKLSEKISKIQLDSKGRKTKVEKIELHKKNFLSKPVKALKIFATNYKDLPEIANHLDFKEIEKRRGHDLGFVTHYIMEKKLNPMEWVEIEGKMLNNSEDFGGIDMNLEVDLVIKLDCFKKTKEEDFKPKVLTYDIETDELKIGGGEILMISLVSDSFKKVITWKGLSKKGKQNFVEYVQDEAELLEKFCEYVKELKPDFLAGYFSDGFDLPYIKARAEKLNVRLPLGLDGSQPKFTRGINLTGRINGIVHVDLLKFIRTAYSQYMQSETLSLNEVAKEFLGDKKISFSFKHSSKIKNDGWEEYFEYNLQDSVLTFGLFEKFWTDLIGFARVIKEPIFEISRNGMSKNVESFIIHNLEKYNEIPERKPGHDEIGKRRNEGKYEGAFVLEPKPGLYENIVMWDFTSSYGSVIVSYNLSKSTYLGNSKELNEKDLKNSYSIEAIGKNVHFSKQLGFFPEMLKEIIQKRKQFKKELKEKPDSIKRARSDAYKLLANSAYGYQGFFGARYYCREAASATAAFARKSIKDAINEIEKNGFTTIYSDTDSIAFLKGNKSEKDIKDFLNKVNSRLPGIMELELEGFFKRGIWVTTRSGATGAKKKYALISKDNKLKIRGFETVRRDWCKLARVTQNKVIQMILEEGTEEKALKYINEIIKKIKNREISKEELIIKTQLKKDLSDYKAISPHVVAARKMKELGIPSGEGNLIEYYIAEVPKGSNSKLVREKVKLPDEKGEYNIEYYLERQILPAVENILQVFKIEAKNLVGDKKQKKLLDF